ncbi:hypothetical protein NDU88_003014 [Pleurodeles waltl]|uniref:Uncharacterized protein n=1 Tax=Pleurodeles waltl TaxID=8319 RepID=A0AAV7T5A2_PLEWA|nr:hypothetical protein NDU88_003014 [Pleurodeles waltl]
MVQGSVVAASTLAVLYGSEECRRCSTGGELEALLFMFWYSQVVLLPVREAIEKKCCGSGFMILGSAVVQMEKPCLECWTTGLGVLTWLDQTGTGILLESLSGWRSVKLEALRLTGLHHFYGTSPAHALLLGTAEAVAAVRQPLRTGQSAKLEAPHLKGLRHFYR